MGGSSSHRRKSRHRPHRSNRSSSPNRSAAVPVPSTQRTLNFDNLAISSGRGYDLLLKSGWSPGDNLGPSSSASVSPSSQSTISSPSTPRTPLTTPLPITVRKGRAGIGTPMSTLHHHPSSTSPPSSPSHSPALVRHLAELSIFDPLRPRCQFDHTHIVPHLKALRKHERTCPANPYRLSSAGTTPTTPSTLFQTSNLSSHHQPDDILSDSDLSNVSTLSDGDASPSDDDRSQSSDVSSIDQPRATNRIAHT